MTETNNIRKMSARWVFTGELELLSAAHFGGREFSAVDLVCLRDKVDGCPLLTGATLAGAIRNYLNDFLLGYADPDGEKTAEAAKAVQLLGGEQTDDKGDQSPLIVFDAFGKLTDDKFEIRDGVKIDGNTGTAADHAKYDYEVLPAGTKFDLRFELVIPDEAREKELCSALKIALEGFGKEQIPLGMKKTRGLGRCKVSEWKAKRYNLSSSEGWLEWLASNHEKPATGNADNALKDYLITLDKDKRKRFIAKLDLNWKGSLLVRAPVFDGGENAPDAEHIKSGGESILPGTSLAGVMRARALKIARLMLNDDDKAKKDAAKNLVNGLFGDECEKEDESGQEAASRKTNEVKRASRLRVHETRLAENKGKRLRPTRVALDRFTGGAVDGMLFTEEPVYGAQANEVELEIVNPKPEEIGLLLLVIKDLLTGDLPIGGESSCGRGFAEGTARFTFPDGAEINWNPANKCLDQSMAQKLNDYVSAFITEKTNAK